MYICFKKKEFVYQNGPKVVLLQFIDLPIQLFSWIYHPSAIQWRHLQLNRYGQLSGWSAQQEGHVMRWCALASAFGLWEVQTQAIELGSSFGGIRWSWQFVSVLNISNLLGLFRVDMRSPPPSSKVGNFWSLQCFMLSTTRYTIDVFFANYYLGNFWSFLFQLLLAVRKNSLSLKFWIIHELVLAYTIDEA